MNPFGTHTTLTRWLPAGLALAAAVMYFTTLAPGMDKIDAGELAAVQATGGIAHPTGYPLFTLLGFAFSQLPLFASKIYQLNFLSLLYVAGSIYFFTRFLFLFLAASRPKAPVAVKGKKPNPAETPAENYSLTALFIAASGGAVYMATSATLWAQATSTEVYSLQALLIAFLLFACARAAHNPSSNGAWRTVAVALGLGLTNHLTMVMLVPAVLFWLFAYRGRSMETAKLALTCAGITAGVAMLIYLWLPLRASGDPQFNWGTPWDMQSFLFHVTGRQFSINMFRGSEYAANQMGIFLSGLPAEFVYSGLLLAAAGIYYSFRMARRSAWFLLLGFMFTVLYVINYDIKDLAPYYLAAYFMLGTWIAWGLLQVNEWMKSIAAREKILAGAVALAAVTNGAVNYSRNDKSDLYFYEDYTRSVLTSLPQNAVVISFQWDWVISAAYYYQSVEGLRPDVTFVDYEILRNRSWYISHLRRNDNRLYNSLQPELGAFNELLIPFHFHQQVNPSLGPSFTALWYKLTNEEKLNRPVYLGPEIVQQKMQVNPPEVMLAKDRRLIPEHYFYRIVSAEKSATYIPLLPDPPAIRFSTVPEDENYNHIIRTFMAVLAAERAQYEKALGTPKGEKHFRERSEAIRATMTPQ